MHAENGGVIDELVKEALRKGQTAPKYHALTRPPTRRRRSDRPRDRARGDGRRARSTSSTCRPRDALEKVRQARDMGLPAYAETCPQYLFLSYDNYEEPGFDGAKYVMSPPLREKWHQDVLWKGLAKNDLQVISTDHCPFCMPSRRSSGRTTSARSPTARPASRRG